ncbi:hypothetical protein BPA30113_00193 [Burkholderia paludis]|uniref:Uncharacterized protein n=1 Tax=Burkholderia paludis TaxID=1506587 RepID=A0A6P2H0L9_9BURK|nr:hypothetical protein LMG30113_01284 [Burkholderia paludis]VWB10572.1 hypothetical protein BPA30113_00193 [Burkholderia paludis]
MLIQQEATVKVSVNTIYSQGTAEHSFGRPSLPTAFL